MFLQLAFISGEFDVVSFLADQGIYTTASLEYFVSSSHRYHDNALTGIARQCRLASTAPILLLTRQDPLSPGLGSCHNKQELRTLRHGEDDYHQSIMFNLLHRPK